MGWNAVGRVEAAAMSMAEKIARELAGMHGDLNWQDYVEDAEVAITAMLGWFDDQRKAALT